MALGGRFGVPQSYPPTPNLEDCTDAPLGSTFPARMAGLRCSPDPTADPVLRGCYAVVAVQRFARSPGTVQPSGAELPRLSAAHWPIGAYRRERLPERVLQFGTGMLLRALCVASVDAANSAGAFSGRIAVIQSTPQGHARAINTQDGLFTLVERGLERGAPVERTRLIGAISRALVAEADWPAVRDVVARRELQVIVSNVTEAGFRADASFPARVTDLLHTRFVRLPDGPPVYVIPTELVDDNGPRLAAMVHHLADGLEHGTKFREWLRARVWFCSSLVDRITTGMPVAHVRAALEQRLGYSDALLTVTEPHALWAIEADPAELRATV